MKNLYSRLIAAAALLLPLTVSAQSVQLAHDKCLAEIMYRQAIANDPGYAVRQAQLEAETEAYTQDYIAAKTGAQQKNASVLRIIPVVFHVIHEGGPENVSREQLVDQIDSLNKDFRRLNADTSDTPAAFKPLGADSEIEFRIATKDPNGNCTDGVVRVYSTLTNNARDNVKALSYWPSNEYLNIWIVKSIENLNGTPGMVIGFAQFPGGNPLTDGVVLMHSFTGSIGTAANSGNNGRTATHEVGHWLNLRHIWGDDNGACTGSDFVTDTPNQGDQTMSTCPNWPQVSCSNGPNGDLFSNYMDYTNGDCQNIFTIGQAARMNAALSSAVSGRNNLWTQNNLIATGTDGTPGALCTPVAAFPDAVRVICEGASLTFNDGSWNSPIDTWTWDFPGGNPSSSNAQNPTVQYPTAGTYDVTLTVTNAAGTNSVTHNGVVVVLPYYGQFTVPYSESFETIAFPGTDWPITNEAGNTWDQTSLAAKTGINSIYINNHTGNPTGTQDVFLTPTYNLSWTTQTNLTFQLAYAARSSSSADNLKVFVSTNCGQVWSLRYNKTGISGTNALATAGLVSSAFFPNSSQWRQETVNLTSSSFSNQPNVRFKFEYNHDTGNNIFIDDINLNGTVGENELFESSLDMNIYPNPSDVQAYVEFNLPERMDVKIDVTDMLGQVVNSVLPGTLDAGEYRFELPAGLAPGVYNVRLTAGGYPATRKVIIY